ncbi:PBSX family phage terminase large subunit [Hymenobacter cellulosilyticus]|uniref:Phage terminase large subunit n=1 Tax=Hymenobacter cellulosilyticus TaxID=2932248 RepID=A0A8T9PZQ3_9BACT|nr:phage terminase large subunit [Hymenobacter cellulosilyticus]UOQ70966.1 phage terminase large subunit [Hymenobacter cellulosilyticus]
MSDGILDIRHTSVFSRNLDACQTPGVRIVVNQGGTRSSKTVSLVQLAIYLCLLETGIMFSIVRGTLPSLKATVLRDLEEQLTKLGLLSVLDSHNKTDHLYTFPNGSQIEYFSIDDAQKVRGRKRHYLLANKANELRLEDWRQLIFRAERVLFLDFNPSEEFHWIYDEVLTRPDCVFIQSTYLDNPFLPDSILQEIKLLEAADPNYWRIYGLGERGVAGTTIFPHWQQCPSLPTTAAHRRYGLDFGYNHPTSLVEVSETPTARYWQQRLYQSHLTTPELIDRLKELIPNKREVIYADHARPEIIEDIGRACFAITEADKAVKAGIDDVKSKPLLVTADSVDLIKELRAYKWKTLRNGQVLDEPVKVNDDAIDAGRYGTYSYSLQHKVNTPITHYQSFGTTRRR